MTWYKDLRRARPFNDYRRQSYRGNYGGGGDQYEYRGMHQRSGGYQRSHYRQTSSGRMRRYSRSSSRSRSISRSPTQSRSRSRSTSRSYDSRDFKKKRDVMDSANRRRKSGVSKKRTVVADGHQGGYESSDSQNSPSAAAVGVTSPPLKPIKKLNDSLPDHQQQISPKRMKPVSLGKVSQALTSVPDHDPSAVDLDQSMEGIDYAYENSPVKPMRQGLKSAVQKKASSKPDEKQQSDWLPVDTQAVDQMPSAPSTKKFSQQQQSGQQQQLQTREQQQPVVAKEVVLVINKQQQAAAKKTTVAEERKVVSYEEDRSDLEESAQVAFHQQALHAAAPRSDNSTTASVQPTSAAQAGLRTTKFSKESAANQNNSDPRMQVYDPIENEMNRLSRKRKPIVDHHDDEADGAASDGGRQPATRFEAFDDNNKRTKRVVTNEGRDFQQQSRSLIGLSHEKMILIKEKKEEIEKAYRQDCETFATVTKLLISKDHELEDRIQNSLRENLREIGHRCIQELRDFVDRVKTEDDF